MTTTILLVIHILITMAMIGLILLQKSEGTAGAGFSGSASIESLMRPRARANPIGRATTILGMLFFVSSLGLAVLARPESRQSHSIMSEPAANSGPVVPKIDDTPTPPVSPATPAAPSVPNN